MCIGPFAQCGLDKALGLAVGFGRVGLGADVLQVQLPTGIAESEGLIATAVVGHDTGDGDAEAFVIGNGGSEKSDSANRFLVRKDLRECDTRGIVDTDTDELPADAAAVALAGAIAGDNGRPSRSGRAS